MKKHKSLEELGLGDKELPIRAEAQKWFEEFERVHDHNAAEAFQDFFNLNQ